MSANSQENRESVAAVEMDSGLDVEDVDYDSEQSQRQCSFFQSLYVSTCSLLFLVPTLISVSLSCTFSRMRDYMRLEKGFTMSDAKDILIKVKDNLKPGLTVSLVSMPLSVCSRREMGRNRNLGRNLARTPTCTSYLALEVHRR
jgi:hypothetical protein